MFGKRIVAPIVLMLAACGTAVDPGELESVETLEETGEIESALAGPIPFKDFVDPLGIGNQGTAETRVLIRTQQAYRARFGHSAPAEVNFRAGDAVIFYSAGTKPTGGFEVSVEKIRRNNSGSVISVTTRLQKPGPGCMVTQSLTRPFTLVKFRLPRQAYLVNFKKDDKVRNCNTPPPLTCASVLCAPGHACVMEDVICITEPCPPVPVCKPVPQGPFCGGIAGFPCPGKGICKDDPTDSCDPQNGGADCGGRCDCPSTQTCPPGQIWKSDANVCACVPNGNPGVQCGTVTCGAGQVCCNASCGICTPPGMACIQIAC